MRKLLLTTIYLTLNYAFLNAQSETIKIPEFDDEYSQTIQKLESDSTNIDYKKFRESFLESKQFKVALKKSSEIRDFTKEIYGLMSDRKYDDIISISKKILSIDYTNIRIHKILRQTYEFTGDTINAKKYKTIQFGLLESIIKSGDGKSCETAWEVIQVSEEYFILDMLDAEFKRQSISYSGGICDKMEVVIDNTEKTYYFDVEKLLVAKQNLNKN